jgi:hypothetical protein
MLLAQSSLSVDVESVPGAISGHLLSYGLVASNIHGVVSDYIIKNENDTIHSRIKYAF